MESFFTSEHEVTLGGARAFQCRQSEEKEPSDGDEEERRDSFEKTEIIIIII